MSSSFLRAIYDSNSQSGKAVTYFSLFYHEFKLLISFSLLKSKRWTPWKYKKDYLFKSMKYTWQVDIFWEYK